jgi:hypothetical protein
VQVDSYGVFAGSNRLHADSMPACCLHACGATQAAVTDPLSLLLLLFLLLLLLLLLLSTHRDTTELQLVSAAPGAKVLKRIASNPLANVNSVEFNPQTLEPQIVSAGFGV